MEKECKKSFHGEHEWIYNKASKVDYCILCFAHRPHKTPKPIKVKNIIEITN